MIELICEWGPPRDLQTATRQAEVAASIGATWSKWQMIDPWQLASKDARRYWDARLGGHRSQREQFPPAGTFGDAEWLQLADCCRAVGVGFLATPFYPGAVDVLEAAGSDAYKIASGDITYRALYDRVAKTGKHVYYSTGAASANEIHSARAWLSRVTATALACDLVYPCRLDQSDLARRLRMIDGVTPRIGYSDHTRETITGAVAVTLGATVLEKHVTLDTNGPSPDDRFALSVDEARLYLEYAREAAELRAPVEGDPQREARIGARRSAYAARSLEAGQVLIDSDVTWLRPAPAGSIPPTRGIAGRVLAHAIKRGEAITRDMLV